MHKLITHIVFKRTQQTVFGLMGPVRGRLSMTNFYEHLGVKNSATLEEIEDAFEKQSSFFDPERNPDAEDLAQRKSVFADILLAYQCLSKPEARKEYDDYISQSRFSANFAGADVEDDPEAKAEQERRKKERGKKRYEEDFSFINNEFYSAWQNRTGNHNQASGAEGEEFDETQEEEPKNTWDGADLKANISITFAESLQEEALEKTIDCERMTRCGICDGKREAPGSQSSECYSCKGLGVKQHSLFKNKESACTTCKGFGSMIIQKCNSCNGQGLISKKGDLSVKIPRFTRDKDVINFELQGHETLDNDKGKNGTLKVRVEVQPDKKSWREGSDIVTQHYLTLGEALNGCTIKIPTVQGESSLKLGGQAAQGNLLIDFQQTRHTLLGKGVLSEKQKGNHVAIVKVWTPKRLDAQTVKFANKLASLEKTPGINAQSRLAFDDSLNDEAQGFTSSQTFKTDKQQGKPSDFFKSRFSSEAADNTSFWSKFKSSFM